MPFYIYPHEVGFLRIFEFNVPVFTGPGPGTVSSFFSLLFGRRDSWSFSQQTLDVPKELHKREYFTFSSLHQYH